MASASSARGKRRKVLCQLTCFYIISERQPASPLYKPMLHSTQPVLSPSSLICFQQINITNVLRLPSRLPAPKKKKRKRDTQTQVYAKKHFSILLRTLQDSNRRTRRFSLRLRFTILAVCSETYMYRYFLF